MDSLVVLAQLACLEMASLAMSALIATPTPTLVALDTLAPISRMDRVTNAIALMELAISPLVKAHPLHAMMTRFASTPLHPMEATCACHVQLALNWWDRLAWTLIAACRTLVSLVWLARI